MKVLVCRCGSCSRWEVVHHDLEPHRFWRVLDAVTPLAGHPDRLRWRCVTCGTEYLARVSVVAHSDLTEVER